MIVPINNGRTITPIYIPQPVPTNTGVLQQSGAGTQSSEPTIWAWAILGAVVIFVVAVVVIFIKLLKDLGGKE